MVKKLEIQKNLKIQKLTCDIYKDDINARLNC